MSGETAARAILVVAEAAGRGGRARRSTASAPRARRLYPRAVGAWAKGAERLRLAAIALFACGAVLSGIGNESGRKWLTLLAFACFILGVMFVLRWRSTVRARVLDPDEKTPVAPPKPPLD